MGESVGLRSHTEEIVPELLSPLQNLKPTSLRSFERRKLTGEEERGARSGDVFRAGYSI